VDGKDTLQVVPLAAATRYELVIGKEVKPASLAKLHKGNHVVVWRLAAPPHVAERIDIHHKHHKPQTHNGILVTAGSNAVSIKIKTKEGDVVRTFPFTPATKVEVRDGKKTRPPAGLDLRPGGRVKVVASGEPPYDALVVEITPAPIKKTPRPKKDKLKVANETDATAAVPSPSRSAVLARAVSQGHRPALVLARREQTIAD
jgi:hypothetical protein